MTEALTILAEKGPLTGKDFQLDTGMSTFAAWKYCTSSDQIKTRIVGRRYLRLDQKIEGYARLSPSIMREFLNYTVVGLKREQAEIDKKASIIEEEIFEISRKKIELARNTVERLIRDHSDQDLFMDKATFVIAGDVVFSMAHTEPRPEFSTGELVRGSDLDIIAITEELPDKMLEELDSLLYKEKYNLLMNPAAKEEMDYIVKDMNTVKQQLLFDDFKKMVAAKILHEGNYLHGNKIIFDRVKELVAEFGIPGKLKDLEKNAIDNRFEAENTLLKAPETSDREELMALFYTTEEKEEIF